LIARSSKVCILSRAGWCRPTLALRTYITSSESHHAMMKPVGRNCCVRSDRSIERRRLRTLPNRTARRSSGSLAGLLRLANDAIRSSFPVAWPLRGRIVPRTCRRTVADR
jgi:hypothetical protein